MIFPLEELIEYDQNMYEITSAASSRSYQLSMLKDPQIEENDGKVVSLAARQVFTQEVEFRSLSFLALPLREKPRFLNGFLSAARYAPGRSSPRIPCRFTGAWT